VVVLAGTAEVSIPKKERNDEVIYVGEWLMFKQLFEAWRLQDD